MRQLSVLLVVMAILAGGCGGSDGDGGGGGGNSSSGTTTPTGGFWQGRIEPAEGTSAIGEIQFFVASDGSKLTSEGSTVVYNGAARTIAFGSQQMGFVKTLTAELLITNNSFTYTFGAGIVTSGDPEDHDTGTQVLKGTFDSATSASGTLVITGSKFGLNGSWTWTATVQN